jgi:hypothetical protein
LLEFPRDSLGTPITRGKFHMKNVTRTAAILLGLLFLLTASAHATTIRSVSNYGDPATYTSSTSLSTLTFQTLFADPSNPVDGGAFNQEVLCPLSVGCSDPGSDDYELLIESLTALAPGTQITVDLGSSVAEGTTSMFPGVALLTCSSGVSGEYCMSTSPDSACFTDAPGTSASGDNLVTIDLVSSAACTSFPAGLVFSIDEDGTSPVFAGITTSSGGGGSTTMPEPGSFLLLVLGLVSIAALETWRRRKQVFHSESRA